MVIIDSAELVCPFMYDLFNTLIGGFSMEAIKYFNNIWQFMKMSNKLIKHMLGGIAKGFGSGH